MTQKRYVYGEIEVVLTGQTAVKRIIRKSRRGPSENIDVKHEIGPADSNVGDWRKWVHLEELYEITTEVQK